MKIEGDELLREWEFHHIENIICQNGRIRERAIFLRKYKDKTMKFKCLDDGSEWERCGHGFFARDGITAIIKRIPQKSELEKWAEDLSGHPKETIAGFKKAIELIESIHLRKINEYPHTYYTLIDLIAELKKYAGQ